MCEVLGNDIMYLILVSGCSDADHSTSSFGVGYGGRLFLLKFVLSRLICYVFVFHLVAMSLAPLVQH
jgi:hypothetical protein